MRLLIISTNRERWPFPVAPLGALTVAAAAEAAGHSVDLLDLMFARSPKRALRQALKGRPYDVIGLSIRNLDNCFFAHPVSYAHGVREILLDVREHSDAPLVVGGPGFSIDPHGWMSRLGADFGVVGEGEAAFPALLECLAARTSPAQLPGILSRDGHRQPLNPPQRIASTALAEPKHHLCRYPRYLSRGGSVSIQSKRGCPFHCIYCTYPILEGAGLRLRTPELVVDEIQAVVSSNGGRSTGLYFTDGVFNFPRAHALEICREIARRKLPVHWSAYFNPIGLDDELARAMARSGCIGVELGLDAATEKMLSVLDKHFTLDDIRRSIAAIVHAGIPLAIHMLFGGPGETFEDIREAQRLLDSCAPANAVFATLGIRIYPATVIERIAREEGVITERTDLFDPTFYVSDQLGASPAEGLDEIARRRPEWTTATDWNRPLLRLLQKLGNRFRIRPQWRDVRNYGRYMRR